MALNQFLASLKHCQEKPSNIEYTGTNGCTLWQNVYNLEGTNLESRNKSLKSSFSFLQKCQVPLKEGREANVGRAIGYLDTKIS